jgi:hypothetical protein
VIPRAVPALLDVSYVPTWVRAETPQLLLPLLLPVRGSKVRARQDDSGWRPRPDLQPLNEAGRTRTAQDVRAGTQNPVGFGPCGFDPRSRHSHDMALAGEVAGLEPCQRKG